MPKEYKMIINNKKELLEHLAKGEKFSYIYFWGHHPKNKEAIDKSCLSQWYPSPFSVDGIHYLTAEHYMMAEKAKTFNDMDSFYEILKADSPKEAKALGRKVKKFDAEIWDYVSQNIVYKGNFEKFSQNKEIKNFLLDTENHILVEASPYDKIWGIGLSQDSIEATNPEQWRGENILGFVLMQVRDKLERAIA